MFVQVIQGRAADAAAMRAALESWGTELGPGAAGWLRSTSGVADDGRAIAVVLFESEEAAQRNSTRPEQAEWWARMEATFDGEPTFADHTLVEVETYGGDVDGAGFVQVMQGRATDIGRVRELMAADPTDWAALRPELLSTVWAGSDDGAWTMVTYFTTEEAAREGEAKDVPPETAALMEELMSLSEGGVDYHDLGEPWLMAPGGSSASGSAP